MSKIKSKRGKGEYIKIYISKIKLKSDEEDDTK